MIKSCVSHNSAYCLCLPHCVCLFYIYPVSPVSHVDGTDDRIVLDVGALYWKIGFSNESLPRYIGPLRQPPPIALSSCGSACREVPVKIKREAKMERAKAVLHVKQLNSFITGNIQILPFIPKSLLL